MTDPTIQLDISDSIATITLNRPDKLNALTMTMLEDLETAIKTVDADADCRVLLLCAAGSKAFCAGADINVWSQLEPLGMWREWIRRGQQVFDRLAELRQPSIAVIQGIAYGGGLELALACDMRLALDSTRLALPEVTLGTIPGWAGTQRLPKLIGSGRAKQMVFTGTPISAATAAQWGLVNETLAEAELQLRAQELAQQIAANAPLAVQTGKQLLDGGSGLGVAMALAGLASAVTNATEDAAEGLQAFKERRRPEFRGR